MSVSPVEIPSSSSTVEVSIIDTTSYILNVPAKICMKPVLPGLETFNGPSYSFLIHHKPSDTRLLFDLGIPKNWQTKLHAKLIEALTDTWGMTWTVEKDTSEILVANGIDLSAIKAVIFSHHHWDHTGDITTFPPTTDLLIGPGFKSKYFPGWPKDPKMIVTNSEDFEGRDVRELDFSKSNTFILGGFSALDFFGDGSFYVLDTPGHTTGHMSALARTTSSGDKSTFMFLGGDITHHNANFRPSELVPLPKNVTPNPYEPPFSNSTAPCPGELFASLHYLHAEFETGSHKPYTQPFCRADGDEDVEEAQQSTDKLVGFDGMENVLTVFAHDESLRDVVDFFPKTANAWKEKDWGRVGHWRFLKKLRPQKVASHM